MATSNTEVCIRLTFGAAGSLNLSALSNTDPFNVFGPGLFGSYVPGGGAQAKIIQHS